jgi:hypothetical protein
MWYSQIARSIMKKYVQMLNEAAFAVCITFALILAFFLMTSDGALEILIRRPSRKFSMKLLNKQKDLIPCAGQLARLQNQYEQQTG